VIEDAAQSLGATWRGKQCRQPDSDRGHVVLPVQPLGGYGDGGACFTGDDELRAHLRELRVHGQFRTYKYARIGHQRPARLDPVRNPAGEDGNLPGGSGAPRGNRAALRSAAERRRADAGRAAARDVVYAQYTIEVDGRDACASDSPRPASSTGVYYPTTLNHEGPYRTSAPSCPEPSARRAVLALPWMPTSTRPRPGFHRRAGEAGYFRRRLLVQQVHLPRPHRP